MKKFLFYFLLMFSIAGSMPVSVAGQMSSASYQISADVFSAGGDDAGSSTNYQLFDSLGEPVVQSATSTSATYGVKSGYRELYADQFITLTTGSASVAFGELSSAEVKTASHTLVVDSNAVNGFDVTVTGTSLTSGSDGIDAIGATAVASQAGAEQFGINLKANTSPAVGAEVSGTVPRAAASGAYATANLFAFLSGDTIATATQDINATTFTVSYIANISPATPAGTYTTTITYAATANF